MANRKTILEMQGIRIYRGDTVILDDIHWKVRGGEHWAVLGANGSGKTSLLSALTGYFTPSDGEIELLGQRYGECDWRELRNRLGIVSSSVRQMMADSEPALETVVTGKYGMIDLWGRVKEEDRKPARRILRQIECEHLADRPWACLSQGERQRILIGRALMAKPRVLILDEPCAGLDPAAREHFLQFIERLGKKRNAPALVLVTHHVEEIMPLFTHVLLLKDGRILASGEKRKILNSKRLSTAFNAEIALRQRHNRYQLTVSAGNSVM